MKNIAALLVAALFSVPALAALKVGDLPPNNVGTDFNDRAVSISSFNGTVVVVTFWASWCGPCINEMNMLARLQKVAGHQTLEVVAVNFKEGSETWRTLKRRLSGLDLKITRDKEWSVSKAYGVKNIPHMFMIDKTGHIARIHVGYGDKALDTLLNEINELLAK